MSLFKSLRNAMHRVTVHTGRTQAAQEMFTTNDCRMQSSELSGKQEDPAGALRQAINELSCYNPQKPTEPRMKQHAPEETVERSQTEIQLANWGAEQGNWGQRFAA